MEQREAREELRELSERIAKDLTLNANDLLWLDRHSSFTLRHGVARNPNTPARLLRRLSQSVVPLLRAAVAANPFIPTETLTGMSLREHDPEVLTAIAQHPSASPEALMLVLAGATPDAVQVRLAVASNLSCDRGTLMFLGDDESAEVLTAVAAHPNSPDPLREALEQVLND